MNSTSFKKWYILVFAIAIIVRVLVAIPLIHNWDGFVFSESAKNMLQGITPYETVEKNDPTIYPDSDRPMLQQWYAYPPPAAHYVHCSLCFSFK